MEGFKQKRQFDRRYIIFGTVYIVQADGKITYEDGGTVALGALSYLALNATVVNTLAKVGFTAAATASLTWVFAIYEAGWWLSYAIDGEDGIENYHEFLTEPMDMHNKWWFTVETLGDAYYDTWIKKKPSSGALTTTTFVMSDGDEWDADAAAQYFTYISPQVAAEHLSPYVYDTIMTQGYGAFEQQGVGIPPTERITAWTLAYSQGQITWSEPVYGG